MVNDFSRDLAEVVKLIVEKSEQAVDNNQSYSVEDYAEKLIDTAKIAILK